MSGWRQKKFWTETRVETTDGGFEVLLDGRKLRTPGKTPLVVPSKDLAQAIAAEWDAQEEKIDPATMPFTRSANSAIDKVATQFNEVAALLAAYGDTDLLCYRAENPQELTQRQSEGWDPLLEWISDAFGVRLRTGQGVMYFEQNDEALSVLRAKVYEFTPFELTAFHDLVGLSGSLVLGLAATNNAISPEQLWDLSRIDETWQEEQWGKDEEASALVATKRAAFLHAFHFFNMVKKEA
ncbi:MAG: ATP12 family protein [Pseudoruegeria sp.]